MFDVHNIKGTNTIEHAGSVGTQLVVMFISSKFETLFSSSKFDWSLALGFTSRQ